MANVQICTNDYYGFTGFPFTPGPYLVLFWNKTTKVYDDFSGNFGAGNIIVPVDGSFIDVGTFASQPNVGYAFFVDGNNLPRAVALPGDRILSSIRTGGTVVVTSYNTFSHQTFTSNFTLPTQGRVLGTGEIVDFVPCFTDYNLPDDTTLSTYCNGTTRYTQTYSGGEIVTEFEINSPSCGWVPPPPPGPQITQDIIIEVRRCILPNPYMLCWLNTLGGWDYWLFEVNRTYNITTESQGSFKKNFTRITDVKNPDTEIGKTVRPTIVLGAQGLSTTEKIAIKTILYSNKVYALNKDGSVYRDVIISPGSFRFLEVKDNSHDIEFEIQDAEINTITN